MSKASLETSLRNKVLAVISRALEQEFDTDILEVSSSEISIPCLDDEGNEKYAKIKVSIPRGTRSNGTFDPYNAYEARDEWAAEKQDRENKAKAREEEKARKEAEKERRRAARQTIKTMKHDINEVIPNAVEAVKTAPKVSEE